MGHGGLPAGRLRARRALHPHDLQVHLRLVESGLAAALLPSLSGAAHHSGVTTHGLPGHPRRQIFTTVRRGSAAHPRIQVFTTTLGASRPGPGQGVS